MRRGHVKRAGEYLLSRVLLDAPTGALVSFGPNVMPAPELLEQGQTDMVLEYFRLCGTLWRFDGGQLARWTEQVKSGHIPQFGADVVY